MYLSCNALQSLGKRSFSLHCYRGFLDSGMDLASLIVMYTHFKVHHGPAVKAFRGLPSLAFNPGLNPALAHQILSFSAAVRYLWNYTRVVYITGIVTRRFFKYTKLFVITQMTLTLHHNILTSIETARASLACVTRVF